MAVFRIEKTRDYTVMSNHHLRNAGLSLKSKGLLSMMLSFPEDWNYTTRSLAKNCKEGTDSIGSALKKQEQAKHVGADAERGLRKMTEPIHKEKDLPPVWVIQATPSSTQSPAYTLRVQIRDTRSTHNNLKSFSVSPPACALFVPQSQKSGARHIGFGDHGGTASQVA